MAVMIGVDPHKGSHTAVAAEDHAAVMKLWAKRQRDLSRSRNKVVCRLHAVLCDLVPGGVPGKIYAAHAAKLLDGIEPDGAVAAARHELASDLLEDLRRVDAQLAESKKRLAAVVAASRTTTIEVFGVGPVVAATVVGITGDVTRFSNRDRFAAFNGTAPIEVSSGNRKIYRLSRRGNRQLNHAIHMAAVTQVRHRHSEGRASSNRKIAAHVAPDSQRQLQRAVGGRCLRRSRDHASGVIRRHIDIDDD